MVKCSVHAIFKLELLLKAKYCLYMKRRYKINEQTDNAISTKNYGPSFLRLFVWPVYGLFFYGHLLSVEKLYLQYCKPYYNLTCNLYVLFKNSSFSIHRGLTYCDFLVLITTPKYRTNNRNFVDFPLIRTN